jgi:hypothetical protein
MCWLSAASAFVSPETSRMASSTRGSAAVNSATSSRRSSTRGRAAVERAIASIWSNRRGSARTAPRTSAGRAVSVPSTRGTLPVAQGSPRRFRADVQRFRRIVLR